MKSEFILLNELNELIDESLECLEENNIHLLYELFKIMKELTEDLINRQYRKEHMTQEYVIRDNNGNEKYKIIKGKKVSLLDGVEGIVSMFYNSVLQEKYYNVYEKRTGKLLVHRIENEKEAVRIAKEKLMKYEKEHGKGSVKNVIDKECKKRSF